VLRFPRGGAPCCRPHSAGLARRRFGWLSTAPKGWVWVGGSNGHGVMAAGAWAAWSITRLPRYDRRLMRR
jgi:hypothetical protein